MNIEYKEIPIEQLAETMCAVDNWLNIHNAATSIIDLIFSMKDVDMITFNDVLLTFMSDMNGNVSYRVATLLPNRMFLCIDEYDMSHIQNRVTDESDERVIALMGIDELVCYDLCYLADNLLPNIKTLLGDDKISQHLSMLCGDCKTHWTPLTTLLTNHTNVCREDILNVFRYSNHLFNNKERTDIELKTSFLLEYIDEYSMDILTFVPSKICCDQNEKLYIIGKDGDEINYSTLTETSANVLHDKLFQQCTE